MPPVSGVSFVLKIGNERQLVTLSNGSAGEVFRLNFLGQQTANINFDAAASAVQSALEALSTIGAGNVAVAGAAGGPYTVTFQGTLAGQDVDALTASNTTGDLSVQITNPGPTYVLLGGQRNAKLNRSTDEADATSKDSAGWHEGLPVIRNWSIESDQLVLESDAAYLALEKAYLNKARVHIQAAMPSGSVYNGIGSLTDFPMEGPHDDLLSGSCTIMGSGALTKV